jgi:hypothetical protein
MILATQLNTTSQELWWINTPQAIASIVEINLGHFASKRQHTCLDVARLTKVQPHCQIFALSSNVSRAVRLCDQKQPNPTALQELGDRLILTLLCHLMPTLYQLVSRCMKDW